MSNTIYTWDILTRSGSHYIEDVNVSEDLYKLEPDAADILDGDVVPYWNNQDKVFLELSRHYRDYSFRVIVEDLDAYAPNKTATFYFRGKTYWVNQMEVWDPRPSANVFAELEEEPCLVTTN